MEKDKISTGISKDDAKEAVAKPSIIIPKADTKVFIEAMKKEMKIL